MKPKRKTHYCKDCKIIWRNGIKAACNRKRD